MKSFEEIRKRWMEDPEIRRYYEEMAPEFEAISAAISNDEEPPISEDSDQRKAVTLKEVIASLPEERQEKIKQLSGNIAKRMKNKKPLDRNLEEPGSRGKPGMKSN